MKDNLHYLYGLPVYITSINPKSFDKKQIIKTISDNYNKQNIRQHTSTNAYVTDIHHSLGDENNKQFKKVNYDKLKDCYIEPIKKYFEFFWLDKKQANFNCQVVNYTASKHDSFMEPHLHADCEFSMVHYISYDKKEHSPTCFQNPYYFYDLLPNKFKLQNLNEKQSANSWLYDMWKHDIEEDDLIIFPSILKHFVRNHKSKKLRITIASNINVL